MVIAQALIITAFYAYVYHTVFGEQLNTNFMIYYIFIPFIVCEILFANLGLYLSLFMLAAIFTIQKYEWIKGKVTDFFNPVKQVENIF